MSVFRLPSSPQLTLTAAMVGLLLVLSGCAGSGGGGEAQDSARVVPDRWRAAEGGLSTVRAGCDVLGEPAEPGGHFTFALTDEVRPKHAPVPHNRAERVVFAQLYETLVNVACDGTASAGLAEHWTCTADSTTWIFTLREGARFWDGTRVTAEDVRRAWSSNQTSNQAANQTADDRPAGASPWSWINARASSITAVDARRLAVQLPEPQARFPLMLAHPAAAVALRQPGWTWPVGTGPARLRASDPAPRPLLECQPNTSHPLPPAWKSLTFRVTPQVDPRDLVASDIDLALARDLDTVGFFDEAPGFSTVPLPWERLYLLVCPPQTNTRGTAHWVGAAADLRVSRDVTSISARDWDQIMFPVSGGNACPQLSGPISIPSAVPRDSELARYGLDAQTIAYLNADPAAAELAGRLSHLSGSGARIAGLGHADLSLALQWQMAGAFVICQDQLFPTGCLQLAALMGRAAWLQKAGLARPEPGPAETLVQAHNLTAGGARSPAEELTSAGTVYPLALGRDWLIVRGELAGLHLAYDGTPLLHDLGRAQAPTEPKATP